MGFTQRRKALNRKSAKETRRLQGDAYRFAPLRPLLRSLRWSILPFLRVAPRLRGEFFPAVILSQPFANPSLKLQAGCRLLVFIFEEAAFEAGEVGAGGREAHAAVVQVVDMVAEGGEAFEHVGGNEDNRLSSLSIAITCFMVR
jgi:hypothetical protein